MLYITTRSKTDSYTAHRVLCEGFASDGGQFSPMRLPRFTEEQLASFKDKSFCDLIAEVLNIFFSKNLTGWDVEFAIGRKPVRFAEIGGKITVAEVWRNTENSFGVSIDRVYNLLCGSDHGIHHAKGWARIAIRIAFLCGIYAELSRSGVADFDVSVTGQDFESAISTWYAREMGVPIGVIICGCNENCGIWDLLNKEEINFSAASITTDTPYMDDPAPVGLERLVYETLGLSESIRYAHTYANNGYYRLPMGEQFKLNKGLFSSVVGKKRVLDIIGSIYRTNEYFMDPYLSIAYGALQDYRSKFGENRFTLLLAEENPAHFTKIISLGTGVPEKNIANR